MAEYLWATDIHLDHVGHSTAPRDFGALLRKTHPKSEGLIVTGDIAEARTVADYLVELKSAYEGPVYFVMGNHDYYRGHFRTVDQDVEAVQRGLEGLVWLRRTPARLGPHLGLIGSGGWYDARYGDPNSPLQLSDFMLIGEIFEALDESRQSMLSVIRARADELALILEQQADELHAEGGVQEVIVATHIPPFVEASWYEGKTADGRWAPYFSSKATGDALLRIATKYPKTSFTVLCGHTHGDGTFNAGENLTVHTGRASYGFPQLAGVLESSSTKPLTVRLFSSHRSPAP